MTFQVLLSATFVRAFQRLDARQQERVRSTLARLAEDPLRKRPGADIKALRATDPPKHRIRVGERRIVYVVQDGEVRVLEMFQRGRGYR